jgi:tetratricopeptide (TPR) repeat protein
MTYELKRLTTRNLGAALEKAGVYRDLNQPEEAESICRDVLDVDPRNQIALRILGLALTDQLVAPWGRTHHPNAEGGTGLLEEALTTFGRLEAEYDQTYYKGVAWERAAKGHLERGEAHSAVTSFEHALTLFQRAEEVGPTDAADPILRWNRCVRLMNTHPMLIAAAVETR